jgi:hypothetical protein
VVLLLFVDGLALAAGGGVVGGGLALLATIGGLALGVVVASSAAPPPPPPTGKEADSVLELFSRLYGMRDNVWAIIPREEGSTIGPDAVSHVMEQLQALKDSGKGKLRGALATEFESAMKLLVQAAMSDEPDAAEARVAEFDQRTPTLPDFLAMAR